MILDAAGVKNQQDENPAIWKRCGTTRKALGGALGLRTVYIITIFNSCIEYRTTPWKFSMDIQNTWNLGQVAFQDILQVWLHLLAHFFGQFGKSKSGRTSRKLRHVKDAPSDFWFLISQFALADTCWSQNLGETQRFMATWLKKRKTFCAGIPVVWMFSDVFGTSSICQKSRNHPHEDCQHYPVMRQPLDIFTKCSQKIDNLIWIQQKHLMYWCILPTHMIVYCILYSWAQWDDCSPWNPTDCWRWKKRPCLESQLPFCFQQLQIHKPTVAKRNRSHGYQWLSRWPHTTEKRVAFFVLEDELNHHFTQMDSTHLGLVAPVILALWLRAMSCLEYLHRRAWDECGMLKAERRFIGILGSFNLTLTYTYIPIFGPYKS